MHRVARSPVVGRGRDSRVGVCVGMRDIIEASMPQRVTSPNTQIAVQDRFQIPDPPHATGRDGVVVRHRAGITLLNNRALGRYIRSADDLVHERC